MKNSGVIYFSCCILLPLYFVVFIAESVAFARTPAKFLAMSKAPPVDFSDKNFSTPTNVLGYCLWGLMPYAKGDTSFSEQILPIVIYRDVVKKRYTYYLDPFRLFPLQREQNSESIKLLVWSDGTIVWRHKNHDGLHTDEYRLGKVDKEIIESITAEISKNGERYFSGKTRHIDIRFGESISYQLDIMLPNFLYRGRFTPYMLEHYNKTKESLGGFDKTEKIAFIKRITGYAPHGWRGAFLFKYRDLLFEPGLFDNDILSEDDINAITPYFFDDLDFFLFSRNAFLALIPPDAQGTETKVRYPRDENRKLIITEYYENGKFRYEYHIGTIDEFWILRRLLQERQEEREKMIISIPVQYISAKCRRHWSRIRGHNRQPSRQISRCDWAIGRKNNCSIPKDSEVPETRHDYTTNRTFRTIDPAGRIIVYFSMHSVKRHDQPAISRVSEWYLHQTAQPCLLNDFRIWQRFPRRLSALRTPSNTTRHFPRFSERRLLHPPRTSGMILLCKQRTTNRACRSTTTTAG